MAKTFSKGLEGVVADETAVGFVDSDGGQLYYRGYPIDQIVERKSFDECAYMLLEGRFPDPEELAQFRSRLADAYDLPPHAQAVVDALPLSTHPMEVIQALLAVLGSSKPWDVRVQRVAGADGHKKSVVA